MPYLALILILVLGLFAFSAHAQDCDANGLDDILELGPFPGAGASRLFDDPGAGQRLRTIGNGPDLSFQDFSIEMWIYREAATGGREYWVSMGQIGAPGDNLHIGFTANQRFRFAFTGTTLDSANAYPPDGQWHHWACTYSVTKIRQRIYRDGFLIAENSGNVFSGTGDLRVGGFDMNDASVHGAIDELRIWNSELTMADIVSRMNAPDPFPGILSLLHAYYKFDEADPNDPAQDSSLSGAFDLFPESTFPGNNPAAFIYDPDCNANGVIDPCDITSGFSIDCNANGIPDECDLADMTSSDCNSNGIPDECDINSGFSQDCNNNGIPDECDIVGGFSLDCNGNSIPDECDIASGFSLDCNLNGVPDECDQDTNTNGIPDECEGVHNITQDTYWGTLELAITNVQPDDVIVLAPGNYSGSAPDDGSVFTIQSADPSDPAIVQSTKIDSEFTLSGMITFDGLLLSQTINCVGGGPSSTIFSATRCIFRPDTPTGNPAIFVNDDGATINSSYSSFVGWGTGAIAIEQVNDFASTNVTIDHCVFANNNIAIFTQGNDKLGGTEFFASIDIRSSLIVDNQIGILDGQLMQSTVFIANSIVHNTQSISLQNDSVLLLQNSNVSGVDHGKDNDSFDADPLFVDPDGPDNDPLTYDDNDYHLMPGSPSVDTGDDVSVSPDTLDLDNDGDASEPTPFDFDGSPRFVGTVDMGPYEYQGAPPCPADFTGEGSLDIFDILAFLDAFNSGDSSADFTGEGSFDIFDILAFLDAFNAGCP